MKKSARAWIVAVSVAAILFVVSGIVANTIALFMTQFNSVYPETGAMSKLAFYFTIMTGTMAIFQPVARKIFSKVDARVCVSIAVILATCGFAAISFYSSFVGWLFSGLFIGLGFSFITYLMGPILINNWFKKNTGTILGVVLAFSNLGGAVFGAIAGNMIQGLGWQSAMRVLALIACVVGLLFAIFGLKYAPDKSKGESAFGEDEAGADSKNPAASEDVKGLSFSEALHTPYFYMVAIAVIVCFFGSNFQTQATTFAKTSYSFSIVQAGYLSSILMIGAICGKIILGTVNDKLGCAGSYGIGCGSMVLGIIVLLSGASSGATAFGFIGAFLFGFGFATMSIAIPFVVKTILGKKYFAQIYGYVCSIGTLTSMFSSNIYAGIKDATGNYYGGMVAASIALVVGIVLVIVGVIATKNKEWNK